MSLTLSLFLYAALFLGIVLIVDTIISFTQRSGGADDPAVRRRLESLRRVQSAGGDDAFMIRRPLDEAPSWAKLVPFSGYLLNSIRQSAVPITLARVLLVMLGVAIVVFAAAQAFLPFLPLAAYVILAIFFGIAPVAFYFSWAARKRRKKFETQLPDALDLIVRSLKVGHPLSSAMAVVAREIPDPIGTEFQIAFDQVTYGDEVPQAFVKMTERVAVPDLAYLSTAIQIQYESGGNLAEVLDKLSQVIRDRFRMFRKVKAITAEGRFSAWFLSCFPAVIIFFIQLVKPDYYSQVYDFIYFPHLVVFTVVLLIVNIIAMKILTNIKV